MRGDQCLFCGSRVCYCRIVSEDLLYDEIACNRHIRQLEEHADSVLSGKIRNHISGTSKKVRGAPLMLNLDCQSFGTSLDELKEIGSDAAAEDQLEGDSTVGEQLPYGYVGPEDKGIEFIRKQLKKHGLTKDKHGK